MWDNRFLGLARHVAQWSKDPSTKCGTVIVDANRIVVGIGYNGFPRGVNDSPARYEDRDTKYKYVVHAEANALMNANNSVRGCTAYIWPVPPCAECTKLLIQSGISRVVSPVPSEAFHERWKDSISTATEMLAEAGIDDTWIEEGYGYDDTDEASGC
jgi:dCMP deaminase